MNVMMNGDDYDEGDDDEGDKDHGDDVSYSYYVMTNIQCKTMAHFGYEISTKFYATQ